jgi:hypothetical protein
MNDEVPESLLLNPVLTDMKVRQIHKNQDYIQQIHVLDIVHVTRKIKLFIKQNKEDLRYTC